MRALAACNEYILASAAALAMLASLNMAHAASYRVLYSFAGGSDGADPWAGLIKDAAGNLYGTTSEGGGTGCQGYGCGTVFELAPDGTEMVLYAFTGGSDGDDPIGGLIEDSAGNLYGTTARGGGTGCQGYGCGTVFEIAPDGTETVLHAFTGGSDGAGSFAGLIKDKAGNLYGTTREGGDIGCDFYGCGTVFELGPDGTETVLHAFTSGRDGNEPRAGLITDKAGNLYGTTYVGGIDGSGVVFKVARDGTERVLHAFTGGSDGDSPFASLIMDKAGNLYGTAASGGNTGCNHPYGCGTVFRLKK